MQIAEMLLTPQVLMLASGIVALLWGIGKVPVSKSQVLGSWWLWRKLLPILPLIIGGSGAFMPGVVCADDPCSWGTKVLIGIWAGFVAAHGRKILKRIAVDKLSSDAKKP